MIGKKRGRRKIALTDRTSFSASEIQIDGIYVGGLVWPKAMFGKTCCRPDNQNDFGIPCMHIISVCSMVMPGKEPCKLDESSRFSATVRQESVCQYNKIQPMPQVLLVCNDPVRKKYLEWGTTKYHTALPRA